MLGVKDSGRTPMAWGIRPGFRGDLFLCDGGRAPAGPVRVRTRYEPARRCTESCAACRVACLAWVCGERGQAKRFMAMEFSLLLLETMPAKEAKNRIASQWKTPRLSLPGGQGIAVRTQWQSGSQNRQRLNGRIKRKRPARQRRVSSGENQPDLSRKIYPACRRLT